MRTQENLSPHCIAHSPSLSPVTSVPQSHQKFFRTVFFGAMILTGIGSCEHSPQEPPEPRITSPDNGEENGETYTIPEHLADLRGSLIGVPFILTVQWEDGSLQDVLVTCRNKDGIPSIEVNGRVFYCVRMEGPLPISPAQAKDFLGATDAIAEDGIILKASNIGTVHLTKEACALSVCQMLAHRSHAPEFRITVCCRVSGKGLYALFDTGQERAQYSAIFKEILPRAPSIALR